MPATVGSAPGTGTPAGSRCRLAVLGAGSWGSALAIQLARSGAPCVLWARDPAHVAALRNAGTNERFLPGVAFPDGVRFTADVGEALASADDVRRSQPRVH